MAIDPTGQIPGVSRRPRSVPTRASIAPIRLLIPLVVATSLTIGAVQPRLLVPYLLLIAGLLYKPGRRPPVAAPAAAVASDPPASDEEPVDSGETEAVAEVAEAPAVADRRSKGAGRKSRGRPKAVASPEPPPATWVRVGPGKFVRIDPAESPTPPTDDPSPDAPADPSAVDAPGPDAGPPGELPEATPRESGAIGSEAGGETDPAGDQFEPESFGPDVEDSAHLGSPAITADPAPPDVDVPQAPAEAAFGSDPVDGDGDPRPDPAASRRSEDAPGPPRATIPAPEPAEEADSAGVVDADRPRRIARSAVGLGGAVARRRRRSRRSRPRRAVVEGRSMPRRGADRAAKCAHGARGRGASPKARSSRAPPGRGGRI